MAIHASQKIVSVQNPKSLIGNWIFTLLWCALSFTLFGVFAIVARDLMGGIISGFFALFGVAMLYESIRATLEYSRYGKVHFALARPLEPGGKVEGRLELPANLQAGHVSAELACVQVAWSRNSKGHPSKSEHDAWTGKQVFAIRRGAVASEAMLAMDIPADQPGSSLPNEGPGTSMFEGHPGAGVEMDHSYTRWELRIKADVAGVDLGRTFRLKVGGGGAAAPVPAPRPERPPLDAALEQRLDARKAAERKLGAACAIIGFVPFLVPFAIVGIGVGLAGCPMGWSDSNPPNCMLAGINWGRFMAATVKLMFIAVPAGIAGSAVLYFAGQVWLDRHNLKNKAAGPGRFAQLAIGAVVVGFFVYHAWQFTRPFRTPSPASSAESSAQPVAAGTDASNVDRGYRAQYVNVTGRDFTAEVHGAELRVRVGEIRLETTNKLPATPYHSLGINVYQRGRNLGIAYSPGVSGNLTAAAPFTVLTDRVFSLPGAGAACAQGGCEARLILAVQTSPSSAHGENTDFAALTPVVVQEASKATRGQAW